MKYRRIEKNITHLSDYSKTFSKIQSPLKAETLFQRHIQRNSIAVSIDKNIDISKCKICKKLEKLLITLITVPSLS